MGKRLKEQFANLSQEQIDRKHARIGRIQFTPLPQVQLNGYARMVRTILDSGNADAKQALVSQASQNEDRLVKIAKGSQTIGNENMIARLETLCREVISQFQLNKQESDPAPIFV